MSFFEKDFDEADKDLEDSEMIENKTEVIEAFAIPVSEVVVFPWSTISIELEEKTNIQELKKIIAFDDEVLVVIRNGEPSASKSKPEKGYYNTAVLAKVKQLLKNPDSNNYRATITGIKRVNYIGRSRSHTGYALADLGTQYSDEHSTRSEATINEARAIMREYIKHSHKDEEQLKQLMRELSRVNTMGEFSDRLASDVFMTFDERRSILDIFDPYERIVEVICMLRNKLEIMALQNKIHREVKNRVDQNQKEYYLTEQIKVLREELGEGMDTYEEYEKYVEKIESANLPEYISEKLVKEAAKLKKFMITSPEFGLMCNYLDACLSIPWSKTTEDRLEIATVKAILDRDHEGLEKIKERIVEYLAVKQLSPSLGNQIICLVGPPGTGKTSIARSVAEAMGRNYVRISLGGVRDEADIRGHRRTYIGAMPGRIADGLIKAKSMNPVMLIDEIDKMAKDSHGDPAAAMLEVLDGEQNVTFRDHFIDIDVDLSQVMFIATANSLDTIPKPLLDRMEIIELKSYSMQEKFSIAKRHLIPKQMKKHGLNKSQMKISDSALKDIINGYTHEAGVRELERKIATLCRKVAQQLVEGKSSVSVNLKDVGDLLGSNRIIPEVIAKEDEIGVVNGLAYTQSGGSLLKVESISMPGTGKLELTGSLGDVMQESAKIAVSYIRAHSVELGIDEEFYKKRDIHIHFPEGAIPKDGPSAGVTMVCALVSELSGKPVKRNVAMTGEVTLRGKVLAIGGLKEKTMAAYKAGVDTVLIPDDNKKDITDLDPVVRSKIKFITCKEIGDVLINAIIS